MRCLVRARYSIQEPYRMQSFANEPGLHLLAMLQYIEQSWVAVDQAHRTVMSLNDSPTAVMLRKNGMARSKRRQGRAVACSETDSRRYHVWNRRDGSVYARGDMRASH